MATFGLEDITFGLGGYFRIHVRWKRMQIALINIQSAIVFISQSFFLKNVG